MFSKASQKSSATAPQSILTATIMHTEKKFDLKDEKKLEVKAVDSKNIFRVERYLEGIQKNTATSIDLSEQKEVGFSCQKVITVQDFCQTCSFKSSLLGGRKEVFTEDSESECGGVYSFSLMFDGSLITISLANVIRIWDVKTGECKKSLDLRLLDEEIARKTWNQFGSIHHYCLHMSALSNGQIATAEAPSPPVSHGQTNKLVLRERTIDIWDIGTGKRITQFKSKDYAQSFVSSSKNGTSGVLRLVGLPNEQLLVLGIKGFEIWDVKKRTILHSGERKPPSPVAGRRFYDVDFLLPFSGMIQMLPNGNVIGFQREGIDLWVKDSKSAKQVKILNSLDLSKLQLHPMAVLPDGRIALSQYIYSRHGEINSEHDSVDKKSYKDYCNKMGKHGESVMLLYIGIYDQEYTHIENFGPVDFDIDNFTVITQLLALRDGRLVSATNNKKIQVWDTANGACLTTLDAHGSAQKEEEREVISLIELPDGRLVSGSDGSARKAPDRTMRFWQPTLFALKPQAIEPVLTALKTNRSVTQLNLQNTALDDNAISVLIDLLASNTTLTLINLRNTAITLEGMKKLLSTVKNRKPSVEIQSEWIAKLETEEREAQAKTKAQAEAAEKARKEAEIKAKADAEMAERVQKDREAFEAQAKEKAAAEAAERLRKEQELKAQQEAAERKRQEEKQKQLQELHKKGEQGDIAAQCDLAVRYEKGDGVAKDPQQVAYWCKKAAEQGNDTAQQKLGAIFEKGLTGKKDYAQAFFWYQKAADQGNDDACLGLKSLREKGYSPPPSTELKATPVADKSPAVSVTSVVKDAKSEEKDVKTLGTLFDIAYDQLTFGKELGRGSYGVVYQGTWRFNEVAIKQFLSKKLSAEALTEFNSESEIMAQLRSEYIVQFYGRCVSPTYCLVMQMMPKGSLFNLLHSSQPLDWSARYRIVSDIASGLAFLHSSNIFHRDLKSLNVLLDEHYRAKLCDFGLSKVKEENQSTSTIGGPVGTLRWMAPELMDRGAKFTSKADIYSLAMTLWEIASRKVPFADASNPSLIPVWVAQGQREDIPADCPLKVSSLIRFCWHTDPAKRPTAAEVVTYLRSDQTEFKSTEAAPSASTTASIQGNLVSDVGSDLGSSSIRANLLSGLMG